METTKNKIIIIKGIKTLSRFPLYCVLFVSTGGVGDCGSGKIPVIKIQGNSNGDNEKKSILDTETDQETPDEEAIGQDNHGYKSSSTSTDENNHVDENNNNLDENNNVVEAPSGTKKVLYIKEKKQPNIPEATPKKSNIDSKTKKADSPVKKETKASDQPVKPKQNINKEPQSITSSSPKKHKPEDKKVIASNFKLNYQSSNSTENKSSESESTDRLLDQKIEFLLKDKNVISGVNELKNLIDQFTELCKNNYKTEKKLLNKKQKTQNIEKFCGENDDICVIQTRIKNKIKQDQNQNRYREIISECIKTISNLTDIYKKDMNEYIKKEQRK